MTLRLQDNRKWVASRDLLSRAVFWHVFSLWRQHTQIHGIDSDVCDSIFDADQGI